MTIVIKELSKKKTKERMFEFCLLRYGDRVEMTLVSYRLRKLVDGKWQNVAQWDPATECLATIKRPDIKVPSRIKQQAIDELISCIVFV
jgi:hypothetical protein